MVVTYLSLWACAVNSPHKKTERMIDFINDYLKMMIEIDLLIVNLHNLLITAFGKIYFIFLLSIRPINVQEMILINYY